jgi:heterodisulfide reductase subunit A
MPGGTRIVVAACPRLARGGEALRNAKESFPGFRAGLADIREGCAWQQSGAAARTVQAAATVNAAFAGLDRQIPAEPDMEDVPPRVLVIGAGPAGMAAASTLAAMGADVTLAEKRPAPGGMLNQLGLLFPSMENASSVKNAMPLEGVRLLAATDVSAIVRSGPLYEAQMKKAGTVTEETFSAVIIATGAMPVLPGKALRAGELKGVISQMELDTLLSQVEQGKKEKDALPHDAVFVQCVHARTDEEPYCSAVCCPTAVKNALRLKRLDPECRVTVLNRQMVMPGIALEKLYREAMRSGVRFLHVDSIDSLRVEGEGSVEAVVVPARPGCAEERIEADRLVCSTPLRPAPAAAAFAGALGLRMEAMGFLRGHEPAHPLESDAEGVFICGSARWPAYAAQALDQGRAAAVLAMRWLRERRMPMAEVCGRGPAARIQAELCSGCGRCEAACPHGACAVGADGISHVEPSLCRSCGTCAAVCPCKAAILPEALPAPRELAALCGASPRITRRVL